jgi:hypothetical protein
MIRAFLPPDEHEEATAHSLSAQQTPYSNSTISIYEEGSDPDSENPKFTKEVLEVVRRVYDEHHRYVTVGLGMKDHCRRNGLLGKKVGAGDHSGRILMRGSKNYYREYDTSWPTWTDDTRWLANHSL